jgi:hypothetical protein
MIVAQFRFNRSLFSVRARQRHQYRAQVGREAEIESGGGDKHVAEKPKVLPASVKDIPQRLKPP